MTDAVGWVNPVCEWLIMTIHPAVAPSGATGLAGSLMRHRHRLLQERSLTRRFLSAGETADQVEREGGGVFQNPHLCLDQVIKPLKRNKTTKMWYSNPHRNKSPRKFIYMGAIVMLRAKILNRYEALSDFLILCIGMPILQNPCRTNEEPEGRSVKEEWLWCEEKSPAVKTGEAGELDLDLWGWWAAGFPVHDLHCCALMGFMSKYNRYLL